MDLDKYFKRIGYSGGTAPTLETLAALHTAHVFSIPFENLDVYEGRAVSLEPGAIFEKLVTRRRGGYCYEMNTLFASVLRQMGFNATDILARASNGGAYSAKLHHAIMVRLGDSLYLADVGYGSEGISAPLKLEFCTEQRQFADVYRFTRDNNLGCVLERGAGDGFISMYAFKFEEALPVDIELAHYYSATHAESFFRAAPFCTMPNPSGRVTLKPSLLKIRENGDTRECEVAGEVEFKVLLEQYFGISV